MNLIEFITDHMEYRKPTDDEVTEIVELISGQSVSEFAKANILPDDVHSLALADEDFMDDVKHELLVSNADFDEYIKPGKLAYHLAYENTELGTHLLNELLYYRKLGRI